jgi:hypothetical protein
MKKEYLILIALILLLSAYLLFNKEDKDHFPLPSVTQLTPAAVTGLTIVKKEETVTLAKKDKAWFIRELDRPADSAAVENMLDALKGFKLSALVSQKKDVNRYELDPENRIHVNVFEGDKIVFEFDMGKTAPTFNHTFVMIAGDSNIYHAKGSFRSYFQGSAQELRDKQILGFKEKSITALTIEKEGKTDTFTAFENQNEDKEATVSWQSGSGSAVDKTVLEDLLSALALIKCDRFLDDDQKKNLETQSPFCRIHLKGDGEYTLTLLKEPDAETLSGLSSMNPDAFVLSKFNGDDIIEKADTLLGIKKEEASEQ